MCHCLNIQAVAAAWPRPTAFLSRRISHVLYPFVSECLLAYNVGVGQLACSTGNLLERTVERQQRANDPDSREKPIMTADGYRPKSP